MTQFILTFNIGTRSLTNFQLNSTVHLSSKINFCPYAYIIMLILIFIHIVLGNNVWSINLKHSSIHTLSSILSCGNHLIHLIQWSQLLHFHYCLHLTSSRFYSSYLSILKYWPLSFHFLPQHWVLVLSSCSPCLGDRPY